MKTDILQKKLERYLNGDSLPAETRQIQSWLSVTADEAEMVMSAEEKESIEMEILTEIREYTAYPLFYPGREKAWWQKAVAAFF